MITPRAGDRIERWLLDDDSPFARQMSSHVEEWDPDADLEGDPQGRAAWDADPVGEFVRRFGSHGTDTSYYSTDPNADHEALARRKTTTIYETVAFMPSEDPDGHTTWRLLMKIAWSRQT